jgi:drug/metabolite transporter (DMT)-like permease
MTDSSARGSSPASLVPAGVTPRVLVAIIVTILLWASAFIVIRGTSEHLSGGGLALARLVVGTIVLGLLMIGRPWVRPSARQWVALALYGVAWFGAYNVALNIAEQSLDAGTTAMIVNIGPILIALGAGVFLGEGIPKWLAIGASVAFVGVVLIGIGSSLAAGMDGSRINTAGVLWSLAAAVTYSAGVLVQKPLLRSLPAAQVTWLGCVAGTLACLPFTGDLVGQVQAAPTFAIVGAVYLGVGPTAVAFSTWAYALARVPAGQLSISTYIVPPLVIVLGWLLFSEVPAPLAIVGGVLCLVGVGLSRRRTRAAVVPPQHPTPIR